jgi:hypothetical protein
MMNWNISRLDCKVSEGDLSDVCIVAHWQCSDTVDGYSASLPAPDPTNFTPYANLTQEQVLGWIWANGVDKDATEAAVLQQIENQKNPPVVAPPLPWAA